MRFALRWVIFSVLFVAVLWYASREFPGWSQTRVTIINQSGERVAFGTLELCDERVALDGMANGESKRVVLPIKGDCHYQVEVKLASGQTVSGGVGYVSHGLSTEDAVVIQTNQITLGRRPPR